MEAEQITTPSPLSAEERNTLLYDWNPAPTPYPSLPVHALFEKQVIERGESVALIFEDRQLSYQELNKQANRLAHYLIEIGVRPGQSVALFLERGLDQIVATLAILKAGAVYIPLDVEFPQERIVQMLEDAPPHCVLSNTSLAGRIDDPVMLDELADTLRTYPESNPAIEHPSNALAYIMYTSGSTGRPKGVEVTHRGIVRLLFGGNYVPLNTNTIILHMAATSFDAATFEIWGALLQGGTCVLCPSRVPTLDTIGQLLAAHRINTFWMTSALFNLVISEAPQLLKPVKYLLVGGEALSPRHVEKALRELPETQLINGYGPTENTTFSTTYTFDRTTFDPARPIPIGRAIGNSTCYVLDAHQQLVPVGVPGELYLGGDGLARGYINRPDLTAECFFNDPFSSESDARMYKTGDRVCWNPEGLIEFLGRIDHQIKLRGFRIELQEIDLVIGAHPKVEQAITTVFEDAVRGKGLACYVKGVDLDRVSLDELEKFAYTKLPDYMVPARFIPVKEWSYTPSGKLDRKALPKPLLTRSDPANFQAPENETQKALVGIWEHLLQIKPISIDDHFFELGGDSLRAVHLFHEIHQHLGRELPLATLMQSPTLRGLAAIIDGHSEESPLEGFRSLQCIQKGDPDVAPLFMIHGGAGNVVVFRELAHNLGADQPVYAFQWSGWDGHRGDRSIPEMAAAYKEELLRFHPSKTYRLGGHCMGGLIAIELAQQLRAENIGIDGPIVVSDCPNLKSIHYHQEEPDASGLKRFPWVISFVRRARALPQNLRINWTLIRGRKVSMKDRAFYSSGTLVAAAKRYTHPHYPGDILYFRSACMLGRNLGLQGWWDDPFLGFGELCEGRFETHEVGGEHNEVLSLPEVAELTRRAISKK